MLGGLDVDVGRAVLDRLGDQQVHVLDDRGVLDHLGEAPELLVVALVVRHRRAELVELAVGAAEPVDRGQQVLAGGDDGLRLHPGQLADVVQGEDVAGVGHRDDELAVLEADRQHGVALADGGGHLGHGGGVDGRLRQVDEAEADLLGERGHQLALGEQALVHEHAAERAALLLVHVERGDELLLGDEAVLEQDVDELTNRRAHEENPVVGMAVPGMVTSSADRRHALNAA